jgi:hypothetical protein
MLKNDPADADLQRVGNLPCPLVTASFLINLRVRAYSL